MLNFLGPKSAFSNVISAKHGCLPGGGGVLRFGSDGGVPGPWEAGVLAAAPPEIFRGCTVLLKVILYQ